MLRCRRMRQERRREARRNRRIREPGLCGRNGERMKTGTVARQIQIATLVLLLKLRHWQPGKVLAGRRNADGLSGEI